MLYELYGMVVSNDELFPELIPSTKGNAHLRIKHLPNQKSSPSPSHWFMSWHFPGGELWLSFAKIDGGYLLRFNELGDFFVKNNGDEIVCMPRPGIPENTIRHLLLDQVIPLVINLRGGETLHASAVLAPQGIIAFAGPSGSGKSTLIGSFIRAGYPYVSDDCLTLLEKEQEVHAIPAYPGLRLWRDAKNYLFGDEGSLKSVAHYTSKVRVDIEKNPETYGYNAQPLMRLYAIADPSEANGKTDIMIKCLSLQESFMVLVRCAFRLDITDQAMLKRQFHFLERVASKVSVRVVTFPRNFRFLPAVREAILNDLKDLEN